MSFMSVPPARARRRTPARQVRLAIQRLLDLMTEVPAIVNNARLDLVATNPLGQACSHPSAPPRRTRRTSRSTTPGSLSSTPGPAHLNFEVLELPADPGLSLLASSAHAGSPADDALHLLASWVATHDPALQAPQT